MNYTVLGIDASKFSDPVTGMKYRMGATILNGGAYELANALEETKTALTVGSYRSRDTATTGAATITGTGDLSITLALSDTGKFQVGDAITNGTSTGTINQLIVTGTNGLRISTSNQFTATGTLRLLEKTESVGLIRGITGSIVTNKGTVLPY